MHCKYNHTYYVWGGTAHCPFPNVDKVLVGFLIMFNDE